MARWILNRRLAAVCTIAMCALLLGGCSQMNHADEATRSSDKVREETNQASSRILEIINLKGKVTEPGAMTQRCSDYAPEENIYRASHPWSMYDVPIADM